MIEEGMVENSAIVGPILQSEIAKINSPLTKEVRGRGLFIGIELKKGLNVDANDFSKILMKKGLITKATHNVIVRLTPALVITKEECYQAAEIIRDGIKELEKLNEQRGNSKK
jgi:ornithine--oxo-acid transaminase